MGSNERRRRRKRRSVVSRVLLRLRSPSRTPSRPAVMLLPLPAGPGRKAPKQGPACRTPDGA
eukprot:8056096-Pyramimonas_sp.AAC.1